MPKLLLPDVGIGNVGSLLKMFRHLGVEAHSSPEVPEGDFTHLILSGVGHFDSAMRRLETSGWSRFIRDKWGVEKKTLGLCLGAQILGNASEEGVENGLGLLDFRSLRFPEHVDAPTPRMEWGFVDWENETSLAPTNNIGRDRYFFAHSFWMAAPPEITIATSSHGEFIYPVAVSNGHTTGVQFHPEKSHRFGTAFFQRYFSL